MLIFQSFKVVLGLGFKALNCVVERDDSPREGLCITDSDIELVNKTETVFLKLCHSFGDEAESILENI